MKNVLKKLQLQNAVAVSGTTTYNSPAVDIQQQDSVGFEIVGTGTATGSLNVQVSIDYSQDLQGNVTNAGNWTNFGSATAINFGTALTYVIALSQVPFPYIRLSYTNATNSGTLTSYASAKSLSGV